MTQTWLLAPVAGSPTAPPDVSLLTSARTPDDGPGSRWETGFAYVPEQCGGAGVVEYCGTAVIEPPALPGQVGFVPFAVEAAFQCTSMDFGAIDYEGRARRAAVAATPQQLEAEFWSGTLAQAHNAAGGATAWPNRWLANSTHATTIGSAGMAPLQALALLEQRLADGGQFGARGMIHATPQLVELWSQQGNLLRVGNRITTIRGTIIVPGVGYPGTGPDGTVADGTAWAYATDMVDVRVQAEADIAVLPRPGDDFSQALDRDRNTILIRAERMAAATWDGCRHYAVNAALT